MLIRLIYKLLVRQGVAFELGDEYCFETTLDCIAAEVIGTRPVTGR